MTLGEIIQRVQSDYSHGVESEDTRLSSRHIYSKIQSVRSRLLSQQAKRKQLVNSWNYQNLFVPFELVPNSIIPSLNIGTKILRSIHKVPRPLTDFGKHLIKSVSTLDGMNVNFKMSDWNNAKASDSNKFTSNVPLLIPSDGYIFLLKTKQYEGLVFNQLLDDPLEAINFENKCGKVVNCQSYLDFEYPMDNELLEAMIPMVKEELIELFNSTKEDASSNARDNTANNRQP